MVEAEFSIKTWYEILNWNNIPNFGVCHSLDDFCKFKDCYFLSPELRRLEVNLLETLTGEFEHQNIKIMGRPGCGKTTFIHYLLKGAKNGMNDLLSRYFFYIFPANRAAKKVSSLEEAENIIQRYVLDAWQQYYKDSGHSNIINRITVQDISSKEKCNLISDNFKRKKAEFNKLLIFIIDDADLLEPDEIQNIVKAVLRNLALSGVKKWLVMRESTYNKYDKETKGLIKAFFPDPVVFPEIGLFEIINHRIQHTSGSDNPKNPFSEILCYTVLERLFNGNLREALSVLKKLLEYSSTKGLSKSVDEKFIQNYIDRISINTFIRLNSLPNIYDRIYRISSFPVVLDILLLTRYLNSEELLYAGLNKVTTLRAQKARIIKDDREIKIRMDDYAFALKKLIDLELIEKDGRIIQLKRKGALFCQYVDRKYYKELCMDMTYKKYDEDNFWELIKVIINHQGIAFDLLSWEKPTLASDED